MIKLNKGPNMNIHFHKNVVTIVPLENNKQRKENVSNFFRILKYTDDKYDELVGSFKHSIYRGHNTQVQLELNIKECQQANK